MTSSLSVRSAKGYEQLLGRWSKKLAPLFINFAGVADGERILDVWCDTGSLTFALPQFANIVEIAAIDVSNKCEPVSELLPFCAAFSIITGDPACLLFLSFRYAGTCS